MNFTHYYQWDDDMQMFAIYRRPDNKYMICYMYESDAMKYVDILNRGG